MGLEKCSLNFAMPFPFPFPVIPGNNNVSFPFPKFGNGISIPVPKNWEWNFHSRSRSQKLGMKLFIPVPVPKVREWAKPFPFPFPNVQKSFPLTPVVHVGPADGRGFWPSGFKAVMLFTFYGSLQLAFFLSFFWNKLLNKMNETACRWWQNFGESKMAFLRRIVPAGLHSYQGRICNIS